MYNSTHTQTGIQETMCMVKMAFKVLRYLTVIEIGFMIS